MTLPMTRRIALLLAALAPALAAPPARADDATARIELGLLSCELTDRTNLIVVSESRFDCVFDRNDAPDEAYVATATAVGLDLSIKDSESLRWAVLAPTEAKDRAGILEGDYGGVAASVAVAVGVGAKVLLGGFDKSIALQPLSVSGQEGVGASLGIEGMTLTLK